MSMGAITSLKWICVPAAFRTMKRTKTRVKCLLLILNECCLAIQPMHKKGMKMRACTALQ